MKIDSRGAHSVNMTRVVVISVLLFCSLADSARIKSKFISVENKSITFYKLLRSSLFKQKYCLDTFFLNFNIYSFSNISINVGKNIYYNMSCNFLVKKNTFLILLIFFSDIKYIEIFRQQCICFIFIGTEIYMILIKFNSLFIYNESLSYMKTITKAKSGIYALNIVLIIQLGFSRLLNIFNEN